MKYKSNYWSIENNLHWALNMTFREDESRARKDNSAKNFNVIRQIAFNILKSETSFKGGINDKQFKYLLYSFYQKRHELYLFIIFLLIQKPCLVKREFDKKISQ